MPEALFRGRRGKQDEQDLNSQLPSVTSLESAHLYTDFEDNPRDIFAIPLRAGAIAKSTDPIVKSMGNNASSTNKGDRRRRAGSPETDSSDETISTPLQIPTPNLSPLRLLAKRGSASTLHLSDKKRTGKTQTSPTRLTKLQESSTAELDGRGILSPIPQSVTSPPVLSMSVPTSDHSTITLGTFDARSLPLTASTLSPPRSSQVLSPPLSANTSSRPSTSNSQKPSSIYSPFEKKHKPIAITAPPVTLTHIHCYQSHRRILKLPNKHYPLPCMVCKLGDTEQRWKCAWCCLWVCSECMEALKKVEGRDLRVVVQAQQDKKENHWRAMSGQSSDGDIARSDNGKQNDGSHETIKDTEEAKKRRRKGRLPLA